MSRSQKALAKTLYLYSNPELTLDQVADAAGVNINTLKHWVFRGNKNEPAWRKIREAAFNEQLSELLESDSAQLNDIYNLGMVVVQKSLAAMNLENTTLSETGVDRLLTALDKIDKWRRLEAAKKELGVDDEFELTQTETDILSGMFGVEDKSEDE